MNPTPPRPVVEGIPDGAELVRIGTPTEAEFYMTSEPDGKGGQDKRIVQGPSARPFASLTPHLTIPPNMAVIVKPAEGWKFRASIKTLSFWPVKLIAPPAEIAAEVKFSVDNEYDRETVTTALDNIKKLPGFVEVK